MVRSGAVSCRTRLDFKVQPSAKWTERLFGNRSILCAAEKPKSMKQLQVPESIIVAAGVFTSGRCNRIESVRCKVGDALGDDGMDRGGGDLLVLACHDHT